MFSSLPFTRIFKLINICIVLAGIILSFVRLHKGKFHFLVLILILHWEANKSCSVCQGWPLVQFTYHLWKWMAAQGKRKQEVFLPFACLQEMWISHCGRGSKQSRNGTGFSTVNLILPLASAFVFSLWIGFILILSFPWEEKSTCLTIPVNPTLSSFFSLHLQFSNLDNSLLHICLFVFFFSCSAEKVVHRLWYLVFTVFFLSSSYMKTFHCL